MAGTSSPGQSNEKKKKTSYYSRSEFCIVRDKTEDREEIKCQLERALERQYHIVILESQWQGDHSLRWIRFGNFLHKTAVITCLGGLVCVPVIPHRLVGYVCLPLGVVGVSCVLLYNISWQSDPCSKYQVDYDGRELTHIPSHELHSSSPVVLVYRNDKYRKRLHNILAIAVCAVFGWGLYRSLYS